MIDSSNKERLKREDFIIDVELEKIIQQAIPRLPAFLKMPVEEVVPNTINLRI
jgi:hypothetical protein